MLKSLIFASFVALVIGDELIDKLNAKLKGGWKPVKIYPPFEIRNDPACYLTNNTITDNWCKCGGKQVPQLRRTNQVLSNEVPIIVVENDQELQQGFNATCLCKETDVTKGNFGKFRPSPVHLIIKILSENYFIAYDNGYRDRISSSNHAVLLAKQVPTTAELEEFVSKSEDIKNMPGTIMCTKDWVAPNTTKLQIKPDFIPSFSHSKDFSLGLISRFR